MTAHDPIVSDLDSEYRRKVDEVNRWRGRCIECFARTERSIVETLDAFVHDGRMKSLECPSMFSARVEMMRLALKGDTFGKKAKVPRGALADLKDALGRRNALVHGIGKIWVGRGDEWLWHYRLMSNRHGHMDEVGTIDSVEAKIMEHILASNCRRLGDSLQNLVGSL
ncbi:MAG TPA: hypothetical protein VM842_00190 [Nitrospira sp.]|nr:hypothetical protein [Nitrospira sp.]